MNHIPALIFDLDGVLVDTVQLHFLAWQSLARQHDIVFSQPDMARFRGRKRQDCLLDLFTPRQLTNAEIDAYLTIKNNFYLDLLNQTSPDNLLIPATRTLLEQASMRGLKVGVASSSVNAVHVLQHVGLSHLVDVIADGDTVIRSKPYPDIFLWTAGALRVRPSDCIVFEDSAAGVTAARECGMYVIGLGERAQVKDAHLTLSDATDLVLDDVIEAVQHLIPSSLNVSEMEEM